MVRPFPVHASAGRAELEAVVEFADTGRKKSGEILFAGCDEKAVAAEAAGERSGQSGQIEALEHFLKLEAGIGLANVAAVGNGGALQETAVTGEQDTMLGGGGPGQFGVRCIGAVEGVEAEQTEAGSEPAEVGVGDEAGFPEGFRADSEEGRDVDGLEDGVDADAVAVLQRVSEIDAGAVDQDQIHLGVRNAEALDGVLDGGRGVEETVDGAAAALGRQEVVEFGVEAQRSSPHSLSTIAG